MSILLQHLHEGSRVGYAVVVPTHPHLYGRWPSSLTEDSTVSLVSLAHLSTVNNCRHITNLLSFGNIAVVLLSFLIKYVRHAWFPRI